ncbi:MAG: hypothetical protein JXA90_15950 [Planctomycetes bacterium]|nr:hypothetical protein [Planctomycetota bacterium]
METTKVARHSVVWNDRDSRPERPPIDDALTSWRIHNRRRSHLNACRVFGGREYHLKWFFRRPFAGNPALREYENARRVKDLGIPSVDVVGWGRHRWGTFFVMEGSPGSPLFRLPQLPRPEVLHRLTVELGRLIAVLHNANLCHRDLYVDHVLIDEESLRIIDVGRVMSFHRRRWIVKDLAGLLFSAWREKISAQTCRLFLRSYLLHSERRWNRRRLVSAILKKAQSYWRHNEMAGRSNRRRPDAGS